MTWIKEAVRLDRFIPTPHFIQRLGERGVSIDDVRAAIQRARSCEPYGRQPDHQGSCWRVHGRDLNGRKLAVGVEAYLDPAGRAAILCTVMETDW